MSLVKCEKISANQAKLEIAIEADVFNAALSRVAAREGKKYTVPGFRKGKAPRGIIERMYGETVFYTDAINEILADAYPAAVKEAGVEPVDRPEIDVTEADRTTGVKLDVTLTVKPDVTLGEYKGLKAEKTANTVTDAQIDAEVDRMADRASRMVSKEGAAEMGDTANIDFEGFVDDVAFDGGKGEGFDLVLGSGQFIPGFEEQVAGHAAGEEFDVNVTFPEEYQATELAGKAAVFKCRLNERKVKETPVLDDEFAKDVSEFDTLAELRDSIRKNLEDSAARNAELEVEDALVSQIVDGMQADIPACMIEQRTDEMVQQFAGRMQSQGLQLETYLQYTGNTMEKFRADFTEQATRQVKIRLAMEEIAKREAIEVTDEEVDAEIARVADTYKMEAAQVRSMVSLDDVKNDLAVNKAIDLVRSSAVITDKEPVAVETPAEDAQ